MVKKKTTAKKPRSSKKTVAKKTKKTNDPVEAERKVVKDKIYNGVVVYHGDHVRYESCRFFRCTIIGKNITMYKCLLHQSEVEGFNGGVVNSDLRDCHIDGKSRQEEIIETLLAFSKLMDDPVVKDIIGLTEKVKTAAIGRDKGPGALHPLIPLLGALGRK